MFLIYGKDPDDDSYLFVNQTTSDQQQVFDLVNKWMDGWMDTL